MSSHAMRHQPPRLLARWQPAALVTSDIIAVNLALAVAALYRAGDYAHGSRDRFGVLEAALPLWMWALGSYCVGAFILTGIAWQRHILVWLGHAIGAGLYAMLAVATAGAAFDDWPSRAVVHSLVPITVWVASCALLGVVLAAGAATARGPLRIASWAAAVLGIGAVFTSAVLAAAPADGLRGVGPLATLSLLHTLIMLRSGPRPLGADESRVVEETSGPEGQ